MKHIKLISYFISSLFFLFMAGDSLAADWYVDNNASGTNNGVGWDGAWQSFSNIDWNLINPGDYIYISGGHTEKIYTEQWSIGKSGTPENSITIRAGQEEGHNGKIIFDYDALGDYGAGAAINLEGHDHISIDGEYDGERHILIKNLRNISSRIAGFAVYGMFSTNIKVSYIECSNMNNCLMFKSEPTAIEISHNKLEARGDTCVALWDETKIFDTNLIHHNEFVVLISTVEGYNGPDALQVANGTSIYDNTFDTKSTDSITSTQHPDTVQSTGSFTKFYNNVLYNIGDAGFSHGNSTDTTSHYSNIYIYNNIFSLTSSSPSGSWPEMIRFYKMYQSLENLKIWNNLFVDNVLYNAIRIYGNGPGIIGEDNEIKNNIFYNCGNETETYEIWYISNDSGEGWDENSFDIDNNVYANSKTSYVHYFGTDYAVTDWLINDEPNGSVGHPLFMSYTEGDRNNDYHLRYNDIVARDKGIDLSDYFTTDMLGMGRSTGAWDIGAYEYVEVTSFRADVDNSSQITTTDALLTLRNSLGLPMSGTAWQASVTTGDVNCDGVSNSTDALLILRHSLGLSMSETSWCG